MPSPSIRRATADDVDRIARIHVDSWNAAYTGLIDQAELEARNVAKRTEQWAEFFEGDKWPGHEVWVVEDGGRVAGFARVGPSDDHDVDPATTTNLFALYLDPATRGRGLGEALVAHVLGVLRAQGHERATLYVLIENHPARRFYERLGWTPEPDVVTDCLGDGARAPQMRYSRSLPAEGEIAQVR